MSWEDFKAGAKAKYEQCKTFVKEHPVETVLGVIGIGLGGFGIYKLCTIPQVEVLSVATHSTTSQEIITAVSQPSEVGAELAARAYNWHEESHVVSGHLRHLADGRVIPISSYTKVTGGKI